MAQDGTPSTPAANVAVAQTRDAGAAVAEQPPRSGSAKGGAASAFDLGEAIQCSRVETHASYRRTSGDPLYRPIRIYTVDPARGRLRGAIATVNVPYEPLQPGPCGKRFVVKGAEREGLSVLRNGRQSELLPPYGPVDLEYPKLLIRSGHDPAPCDPIFHHQMVYAVASNTYAAFRHALGREIEWAFDDPRLTLSIHALPQAQAVYNREQKAIHFGYFEADGAVLGRVPPNGTVYLCLSHDVVAHEVTHAVIDGLRTRFSRVYASNADVDAFHEAFADLVALLLRFSYADVVREAVRAKHGEFWLHEEFLSFGVQAGQGGGKGELRQTHLFDAARRYDANADIYVLGTLLVSAILEAMIVVYRRKIDRFTALTGPDEDGRCPEPLVELLTHTAARLASHFLSICIRALDYCPPTGLDFGEYLRALVTADNELVPDDPWGYREALIDSFIRRGIYPRGVQSMSEDALRWRRPLIDETIKTPQLSFAELRFAGDPASPFDRVEVQRRAKALGGLVTNPRWMHEFGLARPDEATSGDTIGKPVVESVRSARRVGPDGQVLFDLVCEVTQCRHTKDAIDNPMDYWGGATIIIDPDGAVRFSISKSVMDEVQVERQRSYRASKIEDIDPTEMP